MSEDMNKYHTSLEHIMDELALLEIRIREMAKLAGERRGKEEPFKGLAISPGEVADLFSRPPGPPRAWGETEGGPLRSNPRLKALKGQIEDRKASAGLRLERLARLFDLARRDVEILVIALAPEVDPRYETFYAFLQDDVTRKFPTVDLALNLLSSSLGDKIRLRRRFEPGAPLLKKRLLSLHGDGPGPLPPLLRRHIKIDDRVASYLLDSDEMDSRLFHCAAMEGPGTPLRDMILPNEFKDRLFALSKKTVSPGPNGPGIVFYFQGPPGSGRKSAALGMRQRPGGKTLLVDGRALSQKDPEDFAFILDLILREAGLQDAALCWRDFDALLKEDRAFGLHVFLKELTHFKGPVFLTGETTWEPQDALGGLSFIRAKFPALSFNDRKRLWERVLKENGVFVLDVADLAEKFLFTGGRIKDAAATAANRALWRDPSGGPLSLKDLLAACRLQSNRKMGELARKIIPHYKWKDIILPKESVEQLKEICDYVRHRSMVYEKWGFEKKISSGRGVNAIFSGPSGTGKTMSADIIAGELGIDLYKVDLSAVVSKYIGETEKNLSKIFDEARNSNAILFFDEADAIFGKRSEVNDARDRYANIETGYLLQKMEEHSGIVIMATNFIQNMDEAFARRMDCTVDFPAPEKEERLRIWERMMPDQTPREESLDFGLMAEKFEITGGNIKNIALGSAFLAAGNGGKVGMSGLFHATRREYRKMGRIVMESDFT
jgi:AAA+ superfamily predicted ATPase